MNIHLHINLPTAEAASAAPVEPAIQEWHTPAPTIEGARQLLMAQAEIDQLRRDYAHLDTDSKERIAGLQETAARLDGHLTEIANVTGFEGPTAGLVAHVMAIVDGTTRRIATLEDELAAAKLTDAQKNEILGELKEARFKLQQAEKERAAIAESVGYDGQPEGSGSLLDAVRLLVDSETQLERENIELRKLGRAEAAPADEESDGFSPEARRKLRDGLGLLARIFKLEEVPMLDLPAAIAELAQTRVADVVPPAPKADARLPVGTHAFLRWANGTCEGVEIVGHVEDGGYGVKYIDGSSSRLHNVPVEAMPPGITVEAFEAWVAHQEALGITTNLDPAELKRQADAGIVNLDQLAATKARRAPKEKPARKPRKQKPEAPEVAAGRDTSTGNDARHDAENPPAPTDPAPAASAAPQHPPVPYEATYTTPGGEKIPCTVTAVKQGPIVPSADVTFESGKEAFGIPLGALEPTQQALHEATAHHGPLEAGRFQAEASTDATTEPDEHPAPEPAQPNPGAPAAVQAIAKAIAEWKAFPPADLSEGAAVTVLLESGEIREGTLSRQYQGVEKWDVAVPGYGFVTVGPDKLRGPATAAAVA